MSLKTAGIREFARMIGRSHSWVVSQCQRNIIPKTTDGKMPVDEALKAVARLFAAVRARTRTRGNPQIIVSLEKACRVHMAFAWSSSQKKTRRVFLSLSL